MNDSATERNAALVRRFYDELWNRWGFELIDELLSPQIRFRGSRATVMTGRDAFRRYAEATRAAFADWHNQIDELLAVDDSVVTRMTWSGTHTGWFGSIEPTGAHVSYVGAGFFRIVEGLIEEAWIVGDTHAFWKALGAPAGGDEP